MSLFKREWNDAHEMVREKEKKKSHVAVFFRIAWLTANSWPLRATARDPVSSGCYTLWVNPRNFQRNCIREKLKKRVSTEIVLSPFITVKLNRVSGEKCLEKGRRVSFIKDRKRKRK